MSKWDDIWEKDKALVEERNSILRDMDVGRMRAFLVKVHGPNIPQWSHDDVCRASMHKLRYNLPYFTQAEKFMSKVWLNSHDYTTDIV